jgi:hypothetical protein
MEVQGGDVMKIVVESAIQETPRVQQVRGLFDLENPEAELRTRLYLVVSNRSAIDQLLSLWNRFQTDAAAPFDRGLASFRQVFRHLRDIRRWGVQDRLDATGVIEAWQVQLHHSVDPIRFEAELWCLADPGRRNQAFAAFASAVQEAGGQCGRPATPRRSARTERRWPRSSSTATGPSRLPLWRDPSRFGQ